MCWASGLAVTAPRGSARPCTLIKNPWKSIEFHWISLIFLDFHWISLIFIEFHWFSLVLLMILWSSRLLVRPQEGGSSATDAQTHILRPLRVREMSRALRGVVGKLLTAPKRWYARERVKCNNMYTFWCIKKHNYIFNILVFKYFFDRSFLKFRKINEVWFHHMKNATNVMREKVIGKLCLDWAQILHLHRIQKNEYQFRESTHIADRCLR